MSQIDWFLCPSCGTKLSTDTTGMSWRSSKFMLCENCGDRLEIMIDVRARSMNAESIASMSIQEIKKAVSRLREFFADFVESSVPCDEDIVASHYAAKLSIDRLDGFAEKLRELCRVPGVKTKDKT